MKSQSKPFFVEEQPQVHFERGDSATAKKKALESDPNKEPIKPLEYERP